MKHTLYEDQITHKFAVVRLPSRQVEGDTVPIRATTRWFGTREEAVATLSDRFEQDEEITLATVYTEARLARVMRLIGEYRSTQERQFLERALRRCRRAEANRRSAARRESPPERVH